MANLSGIVFFLVGSVVYLFALTTPLMSEPGDNDWVLAAMEFVYCFIAAYLFLQGSVHLRSQVTSKFKTSYPALVISAILYIPLATIGVLTWLFGVG